MSIKQNEIYIYLLITRYVETRITIYKLNYDLKIRQKYKTINLKTNITHTNTHTQTHTHRVKMGYYRSYI